MDIKIIEEKIFNIVLGVSNDALIEYNNIEHLTHSTNLIDDLGFTSIETITLIVLIEDEFEICIDDEYLVSENFQELGKLIDLVYKILINKERC